MELHLRYSDSIHHNTHAAFIRGADVLLWLKEIDRWAIPADQLECYIIPVSRQSPETAGLFVIFKEGVPVSHLDLLDAYTCIERKLFIPVNTILLPQVTPGELQSLLLWERQVLHPGIGFIGFEKEDRIYPSQLFSCEEGIDRDWSFAHPGIKNTPALKAIQVEQPTTEELIKSIKEDIGQKPLEEIRGPEAERSKLGKALDGLKYTLLKGLLLVTSRAGTVLPEGSGSGGAAIFDSKPGLMERFFNWVQRNMKEIEERRKDEINRLLDLFDKDTDEALQYAIPLDSPYMSRGSAPQSDRLTRRLTNFDLGRLGGGGATDYWDVSDHYNTLRNKYYTAAQKELEQKNFRKAAYIYAHLLGDYYNAANVLEQGNMFREAAALYKDHLKNLAGAAECLERGKLYHEAIDAYTTLKRHEKVGDLYKLLEDDRNAGQAYEKHVAERISHNDYLDASRVIDEKLGQTGRAKQTLLDGWNGTFQEEACLKNYFDIVAKKEKDNTQKEVKDVYAKHTPRQKKLPFLNVLEHVNRKNTDPGVAATTQEIAYEIVHSETEAGNVTVLNSLKRFVPGDRLINSDTSRYATEMTYDPGRSRNPRVFHLDQSILWLKATWHRNQFLAIGSKNGTLHLARGNWYANIEYYSWNNPVKHTTRFTFINAPYHSNTILLHASEGMPVTRKNLPKNKYFNEALVVYCPVWMHKESAQCLINEEKEICRLDITKAGMTIHHYSMEGELKKSIDCTFAQDGPALSSISLHPQLVYHEGYYYTYKEKQFMIISADGRGKIGEFDTGIRFFAASPLFVEFYLVISTNKGCLLAGRSLDTLYVYDNFGATLIPTGISFISPTRFVVAEKKKATVFDIVNRRAIEISTVATNTPIIAILPTSERTRFALIEQSGRVTMVEAE